MKKKKIFGIITLGMFIWLYSRDHRYNTNYEILDNNAYAKYDDGYIYIGDMEYINSLNINDGDILIVDQRNMDDPNIKILDSYKITDKDIRNDIICVICDYNNEYPCGYYRTTESMRLEWFMHNMSYNLNYEVDRARDVDFQASEEDTYDNKVLRKLFRL